MNVRYDIERGTALQCPGYQIHSVAPHSFTDEVVDQLTHDLSRALPKLKIPEYFSAKRELLRNSDHVIVSSNERQEVIGLLASKWYQASDFEFLHIMTFFIAEKYQGTRLFQRIWNLHLKEVAGCGKEFPSAFSLKTFNPISCSLMKQIATRSGAGFYPHFASEHPNWMEDKAMEIAQILDPGAEMIARTGVIKNGGGCVPPDFYPEMPKTHRDEIRLHFENELAPQDRLLCCIFCDDASTQFNILKQFGITAVEKAA